MIQVLVKATREIVAHGSSDTPIPDHAIQYRSGNVYLLMHQSGRMTWKVWETALQSIAYFVEKYEFVDMDFDVGQKRVRQFFGTGVLGMKKEES